MTRLDLAQDDMDAIPSALSADNRSPGTWPAAVTIEQNGTVLVSRHNVRSLLAITPDDRIASRVSLPGGVAGPVDIADLGETVFFATLGGTGGMSEGGSASLVTAPAAFRLVPNGDEAVGIGPASVFIASKNGVSVLRSDAGSGRDLAALASDVAFVWRRDLPGIQKIDRNGAIMAVLKFSTTQASRVGPNGNVASSINSDEVTALTTDATGLLWAVEVTTGGSYLVQLQI